MPHIDSGSFLLGSRSWLSFRWRSTAASSRCCRSSALPLIPAARTRRTSVCRSGSRRAALPAGSST